MKKILSFAMILLVVLSTFLIFTPQTKAELDETPLEVAEKAAVWIVDEAIPESGGYKWPIYWSNGQIYDRPEDMSHIGMFFIELYEQTENPTYLSYAEDTAQWVISKAVSASGGYKWATPDQDISSPGWWLSPCVANIGEFLLKTYQSTGNTTYLSYAEGAAQWMMAMAYWGEPGCFIPYNPPNRYGSQGSHGISLGREARTVTFLLHMYQETGNTDYLPYVEGTAEWLMSGPDKIAEGGGYKWRHNRPYGTSYSIDGHSRIALFFYEIYQAFGNVEYLEHANGAMTWLLSQAVLDSDKAKWPDNPGSGHYPTLPFAGSFWGGHGPEPKVCDLLMVAYEVTEDTMYLEYARKLANWVISPAIAVSEGGGYKFSYREGDSLYDAYQNARVYNFLTWMYDATGETSYSEYAYGAFTWIVYNAEAADGGYKWRTLTYSPYYATWFSPGAAGIGYYLISAPPLVSVRAHADIKPNTLNLRSRGEWITGYIELPEGYEVNDVNASTILLNGTVPVDPSAPTAVGDYDEDGIPDLMVKFDRAEVASYILANINVTKLYEERFMTMILTITGKLNDGTVFQGSDTIRTMMPMRRGGGRHTLLI
jgi:rhamnogalacturonyl hydrolase YesR